jgi:hydrogenase expression/formation protein HypC
MCLAIPALVKKAEGGSGLVEIGGIERSVSFTLTPEAKVGDYVLLHTGFAISVLDPEDALETLQLLRELAEHYPVEPDFGPVAEEAPAVTTTS